GPSMAPGEAAAGNGAAPSPSFPLSDQQRLQLREAFDLFDADGSGQMDTRVCFLFWQITMRALGCKLRKEEMRRILSQVDEEGSGKINFESFLQVMAQKMAEPYSKKEILKGFKLFDCDGTGKISFEKLKLVATEVGEDITDEELQEMIDEADVDGDGEVDQQEFLRILTLNDL
ncbi:CETN1 protein, partial [Asarcornis scutulata]|nr:CETN1 protein [Asarcornis scutulata]